MTAREGPLREEVEGARVLVQMPCRTCQTPTFSSAGASKCFPELSYAMFDSTDAITPNDDAGSYLRYAFTIAAFFVFFGFSAMAAALNFTGGF